MKAEAVEIERPRGEAAMTPEERRSKRRRPHRKKKKPRGDEPSRTVAGGTADTEAASEPAEPYELETVEAYAPAEDGIEAGEGDEAEAERPGRLGFRGIPTWEEAIGLIVDKNLEARAKRSGGGPRPDRGNRGPRDNRGGHAGKRRK